MQHFGVKYGHVTLNKHALLHEICVRTMFENFAFFKHDCTCKTDLKDGKYCGINVKNAFNKRIVLKQFENYLCSHCPVKYLGIGSGCG